MINFKVAEILTICIHGRLSQQNTGAILEEKYPLNNDKSRLII